MVNAGSIPALLHKSKSKNMKVYRIEKSIYEGVFYDYMMLELPQPTDLKMPWDYKLAIPGSKSGVTSIPRLIQYYGIVNIIKLLMDGYRIKVYKPKKIYQIEPYVIFKL